MALRQDKTRQDDLIKIDLNGEQEKREDEEQREKEKKGGGDGR